MPFVLKFSLVFSSIFNLSFQSVYVVFLCSFHFFVVYLYSSSFSSFIDFTHFVHFYSHAFTLSFLVLNIFLHFFSWFTLILFSIHFFLLLQKYLPQFFSPSVKICIELTFMLVPIKKKTNLQIYFFQFLQFSNFSTLFDFVSKFFPGFKNIAEMSTFSLIHSTINNTEQKN